jgi:hypothetical protein
MKNTFLFILISMSFNLFGQEIKTDTLPQLFSEYIDSQDVVINAHRSYGIVSARRYFPNSKIIHKEFIKIDDKIYRYWENDSLNNSRLIAEGNFIISSEMTSVFDTIVTIDPNTYESNYRSFRFVKLYKEGEWFERDSVFTFKGNYANNKRVGKWTKTKRNDEYDERELVYKNDTLMSETQLNLVKNGDFNAIKKALIGNWGNYSKQMYSKENERFLYLAKYGGIEFYSNGTFKDGDKSSCKISPTKKRDYTWTINDKLLIEIDKCGVKERYQLLAIYQNGIYLKILEK